MMGKIDKNGFGTKIKIKISTNFGQFKYSILCTAVVLLLTLWPADNLDNIPLLPIPHFDKLLHFSMFGILTKILLGETLSYKKQLWYLILLVWVLVLAAFTELMQDAMNMGRKADWADFIADIAGFITSLAWQWIYRSRFYKLKML